MKPILEDQRVGTLTRIVEESTRSTREGVKYFIEPAPGTLERAKNKRHHIVFGRRGSGKSSLLAKLTADLTISRAPIAYVDLEEFKGHSYPDVLLSVLIKTFTEFKKWMDTAATNPSTKVSYWQRFFGKVPTKKSFNKEKTKEISNELGSMIEEINRILFAADEEKISKIKKIEESSELNTALNSGVKYGVGSIDAKLSTNDKSNNFEQNQTEYVSKKTEILHKNIMRYKSIFQKMSELADGPTFLLLDDLYHIRMADQANVLDYLHRIAKGSNLWLKVGTIRHRSRWYVYGDPPRGLKLGDDADEIDLDVTLDKYDLTKRFLIQVLDQFSRDSGLRIDEYLTDGARDRLVLASGGVARDFLTIFLRAINIARERLARGDSFRGDKLGAEDVNRAAGEYDKFKREDFSRDSGKDEETKLLLSFEDISNFCLNNASANCFLVDKDFFDDRTINILELVDLKFLHHVRSRVTVRERVGRLYDAYMLDLESVHW